MAKVAVKVAEKKTQSKKSVQAKIISKKVKLVAPKATKPTVAKAATAKMNTSKPQVVKATVTKLKPKTEVKSLYDFKVGDHLVYPTHGVGKVTDIESTEVAGTKVTLYVLYFEREKMTLRVPVTRAIAVGLRKLASQDQIGKAISTLKSRPKAARGMWSRRATEYGQKINSGNILLIAEVVRDLHKNVDDPDRSYSERVIYESAFGRLAGEYAAINKLDGKQAEEALVKTLGKKSAIAA
jgi:CarD family transcriptional regulator